MEECFSFLLKLHNAEQ